MPGCLPCARCAASTSKLDPRALRLQLPPPTAQRQERAAAEVPSRENRGARRHAKMQNRPHEARPPGAAFRAYGRARLRGRGGHLSPAYSAILRRRAAPRTTARLPLREITADPGRRTSQRTSEARWARRKVEIRPGWAPAIDTLGRLTGDPPVDIFALRPDGGQDRVRRLLRMSCTLRLDAAQAAAVMVLDNRPSLGARPLLDPKAWDDSARRMAAALNEPHPRRTSRVDSVGECSAWRTGITIVPVAAFSGLALYGPLPRPWRAGGGGAAGGREPPAPAAAWDAGAWPPLGAFRLQPFRPPPVAVR